RDAAFTVALPVEAEPAILHCSPERNSPYERLEMPVELYQDSSGGPNWRSSNHVNRKGVVPLSLAGYRLHAGDVEHMGKRATPVMTLRRGDHHVGVAMPCFWENFPKALEANHDHLTLRLFPRQ